ncbi:MAG TPA: hypothetical protein VHK90_18420 [Thermoanaerobaculia bacterium]|nr:hypothetical protein [Thermoanaerobaculia bacterium]
MTTDRFAIATRDEVWSRGRIVEQRLSYGEAIQHGSEIEASDARDDALVAACTSAMESMRACVLDDVRMRLVATASTDGDSQTITVTLHDHSIVTTPEHLSEDMQLLRNAGVPLASPAASRRLPLLWKHGTAAVLLHECAGHPLEHDREAILPSWLHVDIPRKPRRATFRDVPLLRMQHVFAEQHDAPFALPGERIEILLIDGGHYEPLTDVVTLHVGAADLVEGNDRRRLAPFTFEASRHDIRFLGASGAPLRYPGVVCSREGQELVVPSHAPLLLTELA